MLREPREGRHNIKRVAVCNDPVGKWPGRPQGVPAEEEHAGQRLQAFPGLMNTGVVGKKATGP